MRKATVDHSMQGAYCAHPCCYEPVRGFLHQRVRYRGEATVGNSIQVACHAHPWGGCALLSLLVLAPTCTHTFWSRRCDFALKHSDKKVLSSTRPCAAISWTRRGRARPLPCSMMSEASKRVPILDRNRMHMQVEQNIFGEF